MERGQPQQPETHPLDDPAQRARTVRALLILSPFLFAGIYVLCWMLGAEPRYAVLIAGIALAGCLGTALAIHLLGSKARYLVVLLSAVLALAKMSR